MKIYDREIYMKTEKIKAALMVILCFVFGFVVGCIAINHDLKNENTKLKDKIDLVSTIKPYTSKFITKGICAETDTTIKNIETLKRNQENRQYTPRVLQDLKCAKKKKGE